MILTETARLTPKRRAYIEQEFSRHAPDYNSAATVQNNGAHQLVNLLDGLLPNQEGAQILEIGCGTGFITEILAARLGPVDYLVTDISQQMLEQCRAKMAQTEIEAHLHFAQLDANDFELPTAAFDLIVGGFVLQWLKDYPSVLIDLVRALKPGGVLALSFPAEGSYAEWKSASEELGLPFTANPLPDIDIVTSEAIFDETFDMDVYLGTVKPEYASAIDFFREMKTIGASVQQSGTSLSARQFKSLVSQMDKAAGEEPVIVSQKIGYLIVKQTQS